MAISTSQRFGTLCMFVGSILYNIFMLYPSHVLEIGFFQLLTSMSIIVIGSILSYGQKAMDDRFLKTLGKGKPTTTSTRFPLMLLNEGLKEKWFYAVVKRVVIS
ncbi:hypothetical protein CDAR_453891 [Caerostris darwini]|uniref:Uncharacterized protein n=1 Tax=Caerostris darwini TaxID=1538125 RepID=A0AAV4RT24_9ARAC|nr:hypothetical protein CDAR_453891 [Caerostris darwini]